MNLNAPVIVFGEGSASVFLISQLIKRNESVLWVNGSGVKLLPVMPYVKSALALGALLDCKKVISDEIISNSLERGTFHRVFRNKAFKMPSWKRTSNLESQKQAMQELVWIPEQSYLGVEEFRVAGLSLADLENSLRASFENHPLINKIQNAPVIELEIYEHGGKIQFSNGVMSEFKQFYFCDALSELKLIPKLISVFKHQMSAVKMSSQMSALQVIFHHSTNMNQSSDTGFVIPMNRDSGETFDRDAIGYFMSENTSVWTVFLQASECEENHEIMKKLRKLKQSLNRAFESPELLPEGKKDFLSTIEKEQVRFEQNCLITEGSFKASESNPDFVLLTDSFGFSAMLEKLATFFAIKELEAHEASSLIDLDSIEMPAHVLENVDDHSSHTIL